ncbi:5' exonuclease Apollo-like [Cucurbita pepo subsp. pepo]|uniref:5' exonuclease Apollo-like n=1 Tax=Cucurbita pepo subsp. pepo TaxID=3664 RepID=UPI000C9D7892|nr:5' exonuclease Apollo-like [Cucurbita pepo subsp. pepo]XP_023554484.1 5' exonuclease Apollo-like [Cucurbita pepo subsp. pepo]
MENGLISVDRWSDGSQIYFLTHLHSDHTKGLSSQWSRGPLFCSRLTAKLFSLKFPDFNLSLLRVLEIGLWHSISLISPSSGSRKTIKVMAIDAHHCPGAVMLLFRGDFGCLLYTGDFRWEMSSERANKGRIALLNALEENTVDILYLDNTYCNPYYAFPSRQIAAQQIVDIVASHPEHDIIIGIDSLGKEDLLLHISRMLKIKICVWPERLQTMHLLGFNERFTTKTNLTRVRAVPRYSFSIDTLEGLNQMRPTIGIMPSGLPWVVRPGKGDDILSGSLLTTLYRRSKLNENAGVLIEEQIGKAETVKRLHKYIFSVPYSDHACFSEIQEFIKLVRPTNIKGIVSSSSCYVEPLYYFGRLCGEKQPENNFHHKKRRTRKGEKGAVDINFVYSEKRRGKGTNVGILNVSVHGGRVSALRRVQRGARLAGSDCAD